MKLYPHSLFREDNILSSLMKIHKLHWNDKEEYPYIQNEKDEILEADDYLFWEIGMPLELTTSEGKVLCDGILFFGDGCMEFHDSVTKDAYHWVYFDEDSLKKIEKYLVGIVSLL